MSPAKHSYAGVTDGQTDGQTDDGQSDPYVSLCFTGDTKTQMPLAATKSNSVSPILIPPCPQGHVMSVKCEQHLDELTVQIWLLYDHPNFERSTRKPRTWTDVIIC